MDANTLAQEHMTLKKLKNKPNLAVMKLLCLENGHQNERNKELDMNLAQAHTVISNLSLVKMCNVTRLLREDHQEKENRNLGKIRLLMLALMTQNLEKELPSLDLMRQ